MSVTPVPPNPSLTGQSALFAAKAQELHAPQKAAATNPHNALAGRECSVGPGHGRTKAQSEATGVKSFIASLSNDFTRLMHGAGSIFKSISSHAFGPSQPEAALQPKKAMAAVSGAQGMDAVTDFLNASPATRQAYRDVRDAVQRPHSGVEGLGREANDALTDIQGAGHKLLKDAESYFKKRF